jgi:hypothetical protein
LAARAEPTAPATAACVLPPRAGFRRLENQLYRVEIHVGGDVASGAPTFKWSRDNGSVVTAIVPPAPTLSGTTLTLNVSSLGRDQVLTFASGQFVELTEDGREMQGKHGILVQLTGAAVGSQGPALTADTSLADPTDLNSFLNGFSDQSVRNPKVRRWDQSGSVVSSTVPGGDIKVQEGAWLDLESGVQVFFHPGAHYQTGDYWPIPARTVTGDVDWPRDRSGTAQFLPTSSIRHHYCRLAMINFSLPAWTVSGDCRQILPPQVDPGIHIKSVFMTNFTAISPNDGLVLNDGTVALQDLAKGISIVCDTPIDVAALRSNSPPKPSLNKPTCFVTIHVPTFAGTGQGPFAFQPMVVSANLDLDPQDTTGSTIRWTPTPEAATWVQSQLAQLLAQTPPPGPLLAHLTLRGNFIWGRDNPSLYLDGESLGALALPDSTGNRRTDVLLPSGEGRRGGDFRMWFWLISLPAALVVSPASIDFDPQPVNSTSAPVTVSVTNNSNAPLTIVSIGVSDPQFATTTTCPPPPNTLAVGATCTISVTFRPSQAGLRPGTLTVTPSSGTPVTIQLTGTGLQAKLDVPPGPLLFGAVVGEDSDPQTVILTNNGNLPVVISAITVGGRDADDYSIQSISAPIPITLPPQGGSCRFDVVFTPRAVGVRLARITISHDAVTDGIDLSGRGRKPSPGPPGPKF